MTFKTKNFLFIMVVILSLIFTAAVFGEGIVDRTKVNKLKWLGPGQPDTYQEYKARMPQGHFSIERVDVPARVANLTLGPKIMIIVNSGIYSSLSSEITRYANSLIAAGYDAPIYQSSYGTAEELKTFIKNNQTNLTGCIFVGVLPAAWYEVANDYGTYGYASFPCDLFLMDLDGTWTDGNSNGIYDSHTAGAGDQAPEIFVARIDVAQISGDQITNLRNFFDKDNLYWTGSMNLLKYGLTYTEDDWTAYSYFLHDISYLYGSNYQAIAAPNTEESDYRTNRLSNIAYEFIQLSCHSSTYYHAFTRGGSCYYYEVQAVPPQALAFNLFCCSSVRYTAANYLGGAYLVHNGPKALSVIGSTKTGSMLDFNLFYTPLGQNKCMGVAFKEWFEAIAPYDINDVYWHYGMCIVGDPMITFLNDTGNTPPTADFSFTTEGLTANFTDLSSDTDGTIVSWNWNFGDGGSSALQNPSHTYAGSGTYTVTLTVTDDGSATDQASKPVTVSDGAAPEIYVYDITQTVKKAGKNYSSTAVVTIWDTNNNVVPDASVYITWSGVVSGTASGITVADGTVTFISANVKSTGPFIITVDNVTHASLSYNPSLNNETSDTANY